MLQFSVFLIPRRPLFEIKAIISFKKVDIPPTEYVARLNAMRAKLEEIVPPSYKVKFRTNDEQLVATSITHLAQQAQRMTQKMEEFIRAAAHALKYN